MSAIIRQSGHRPDRIGEVSGIVTSLNAFVYDVINFLYLQDLVLVNEMKMKKWKKGNLINVKRF